MLLHTLNYLSVWMILFWNYGGRNWNSCCHKRTWTCAACSHILSEVMGCYLKTSLEQILPNRCSSHFPWDSLGWWDICSHYIKKKNCSDKGLEWKASSVSVSHWHQEVCNHSKKKSANDELCDLSLFFCQLLFSSLPGIPHVAINRKSQRTVNHPRCLYASSCRLCYLKARRWKSPLEMVDCLLMIRE